MLFGNEESEDSLVPRFLSDFVNERHIWRNTHEGFVKISVFEIQNKVWSVIGSGACVIDAKNSLKSAALSWMVKPLSNITKFP